MDSVKETVQSVADTLKTALKTHEDALADSLKRGGLVPGPAAKDGLIPESFKPTTRLNVSFQGKEVSLGTFFRSSECKTSPAVSFQSEVSPRTQIFLPTMRIN